jgi:hypothetical protein
MGGAVNHSETQYLPHATYLLSKKNAYTRDALPHHVHTLIFCCDEGHVMSFTFNINPAFILSASCTTLCLFFSILCRISFLATKIEKYPSNEDAIRVVQVMCGEAPRHLVMCPTSCGGHAEKVVGHVKHDWCRVLQCGKFYSEWNICVACSSGHGSHLRAGRAIMHHTRLNSNIMALNAPKESLKPYQHSPEKTVATLKDLSDFGSVFHPQDEAMDEAVIFVNSPSKFAFVQ